MIISCIVVFGLIFISIFIGFSNIDFHATELKNIIGNNTSIITIVGIIMFGIASAYLSIKAHFFVYFIMDKDLGSIDAIRYSLLKTTGLEGELFIIWAMLAAMNLIGVLLYMIGLLLTLPLTMIVLTLIYSKYLTN